jgi:L-fuculose-phosphate aldolase
VATVQVDVSENPVSPQLPEFSPRQRVALLARALHRQGYDDHVAGHITLRQADNSLLVNPFGLTWDEIRASDIMTVDLDGAVLDGPWTVPPAVRLHLEVHRLRDDVVVAVHNHPRWSTLWADAHMVPPIFDQTSALTDGDLIVYGEYDGSVNGQLSAAQAAEAIGRASMVLLANHGVFVVGADIPEAYHRASNLEWRSRQAWHLAAIDQGREMAPQIAEKLGRSFKSAGRPQLWWEAVVRRELRNDPTVLD